MFKIYKIYCLIFSTVLFHTVVCQPRFDIASLTYGHNFTCYIGRVLYPHGPECADEELSKDLFRSQRIDLGFYLTFMGHEFNSMWINQHGFVSFQESFYGTAISQDDWPQPKYPYIDDPIFIAPFYAQTDLVGDKVEDVLSTKYGRVLYKVIVRKDLPLIYTEEEKFIYEMTLKVLLEGQKLVRESVASSEAFIASHGVIITWKNVTFSGNSLLDVDLKPRNTFQMVLLTDTHQTFAIFNYEDIQWYASTSQGGNPETGTGGRAARVGFNRGNGTLWYGFRPFSENAQLIQDIEKHSNVAVPGRYVFRVDEWIQPGGCLSIDTDEEKKLFIWPRYATMLGGQEVNVTGPCFHDALHFLCKWGDGFDAPITVGETPILGSKFADVRARCVQPLMYYIGRLNLSLSFDGGKTWDWKTEYTLVDPIRYPAKVELVNIQDWHQRGSPPRLIIRWDRNELSYAEFDLVDVELWGYYEANDGPHWDMIQLIAVNKRNQGSFGFDVAPNRAKNRTMARRYKLGAICVRMHDTTLNHEDHVHHLLSKHIWSALHPIGWWRNDEMKFYYDAQSYVLGNSRGKNWAEDQCRWWHQYLKYDREWMDELEVCPTTLLMAIGDMGVWAPDPSCNMYGAEYNELNCLQHPEAIHCVITMRRTPSGGGNRCCYDKDGSLMYTNDTISGSTPDRHHSLGMPPYNKPGIVPGLSHYLNDIIPFYLCCKWSNLCDTYLYLRQTKDAKGYREPRPAVAYGDPHIMTFDGKDYTFNGKGEFYLFRSKKYNFQLQARFEQPPNATFCLKSSGGQVNATRITAIAASQEDSDVVEVRTRLYPSQTHTLGCDVLINGKVYYFNYTEEKVQIFKNVYVISPLEDDTMSNITIMFNTSGVGVQVKCHHGMMQVRTSAPYSLFKDTAGLFGYWDNITANDFMHPDNSTSQLTLKPDFIYQGFGLAWRLKDESESLFTYSGSWTFDTFHDYKPIIREWQKFRPWFTTTEIPFPSNVSFTKEEWLKACDGDEQCLFDSAAMGSLEIGETTREAHRYYRLLHESMKAVNSCGIYLMQGGIRTTTKGNYLAGSKMRLSCMPGYFLFGWPEFYCNWNATWIPTNGQWLAEFRDWPYCEHYHLTAIRWTSVGLSILWTIFVIIGLIRYCFFLKSEHYVIDDKKEDNQSYEFKTPDNDKESDALEVLNWNNYCKDGFESFIPINRIVDSVGDTKQILIGSFEKNDNLDPDEIANANFKPVGNFVHPAIVVELPHSSMKEGVISSKIFSDNESTSDLSVSSVKNEIQNGFNNQKITKNTKLQSSSTFIPPKNEYTNNNNNSIIQINPKKKESLSDNDLLSNGTSNDFISHNLFQSPVNKYPYTTRRLNNFIENENENDSQEEFDYRENVV